MRRLLKPLLVAVITVISVLGITELALATLDPWGLHYADDLAVMYRHFVDDPVRGYWLDNGDYTFRGWTAHIQNGLRVVPDTHPEAQCRLIMLGDSVTFGHGVSDSETWVNLVARQLPDVHVVNTGVSSYTSSNVLGTYQSFPDGDAYIYLIFHNDGERNTTSEEYHRMADNQVYQPWLVRYIGFVQLMRLVSASDRQPEFADRVFSELDQLTADPRVTLVAFSGNPLTEAIVEHGYPVQLLQPYTHQISFVDGHPNAEGHQQIAAQMLPITQDVTRRLCPSP
jgi:lysophospholipase L1-like esterase